MGKRAAVRIDILYIDVGTELKQTPRGKARKNPSYYPFVHYSLSTRVIHLGIRLLTVIGSGLTLVEYQCLVLSSRRTNDYGSVIESNLRN
jgi:hypothetical protein